MRDERCSLPADLFSAGAQRTYSARVRCENCGEAERIQIPKERPISAVKCPNCGCRALSRVGPRGLLIYEKLSARSREVLSLARKSVKSGSGVLETSNLLLGLVWEKGIASRALAACGVTDVVACKEKWNCPAREAGYIHYDGEIGLHSDAVKQLLERAHAVALSEACNYIDPEHILLAFLVNPYVESVGKRILLSILVQQGKTGNDLRAEIRRLREPERVDQGVDWGSTNSQVTVTLHRGHAAELLRLVGERPHSEVWSREIFTQLREALD